MRLRDSVIRGKINKEPGIPVGLCDSTFRSRQNL
jgi:hypothetical protein